MRHRIAVGVGSFALLVLAGHAPRAAAINLEYKPHVPAYSVGFEHILTVDGSPPTLIDDGGDLSFISDFNFWRAAPPSLGTLEAFSSISSDVTDPNIGPSDEFHVFSPATGGLFKLTGMNAPGGFYDGENSAFTATGLGSGPGAATRAIWDIEIVSTGELPGTPVRIDVAAIIQGYLSANKITHPFIDDARASWHVAAEGIPVISGSAKLVDGPGVVPFSEDNLASPITFYKVVGDTFTLEIAYKLEVDGDAPGAVSIAEVTGSEVLVFATVVPEPAGILLASLALLGLVGWSRYQRRRA